MEKNYRRLSVRNFTFAFMSKSSTTIYLLTGGNLGDRFANMEEAKRLICERIGKVIAASHFYETAAWGVEEQPDYLNQALTVETVFSPEETLSKIHSIEAELGRIRRTRWESRPIDIDILFFGDKTMETESLTIPHPRIHIRNFALIPLMEIAPELEHPLLKKTIEELYWECEDELDVIRLETEQSKEL